MAIAIAGLLSPPIAAGFERTLSHVGSEAPQTLRITDPRDEGLPELRDEAALLVDATLSIVSRHGVQVAITWLWLLRSASRASGRARITAAQLAADIAKEGGQRVGERMARKYLCDVRDAGLAVGSVAQGNGGGSELAPLSPAAVEAMLGGKLRTSNDDPQAELPLSEEPNRNSSCAFSSGCQPESVGAKGGLSSTPRQSAAHFRSSDDDDRDDQRKCEKTDDDVDATIQEISYLQKQAAREVAQGNEPKRLVVRASQPPTEAVPNPISANIRGSEGQTWEAARTRCKRIVQSITRLKPKNDSDRELLLKLAYLAESGRWAEGLLTDALEGVRRLQVVKSPYGLLWTALAEKHPGGKPGVSRDLATIHVPSELLCPRPPPA